MHNLFLFFLLLLTTGLVAQETTDADPSDDRLAYVAGPIYKIINRVGGPLVLWRGEPARPGQLARDGDRTLRVSYPDGGKERLVIHLNADGTLREVIDLKYQTPEPARTASATGFDWGERREITFPNGVRFVYDGVSATATRGPESLPVTGERGRYRIETEEFEAGVAFGPQWSRVYHYFTPKH